MHRHGGAMAISYERDLLNDLIITLLKRLETNCRLGFGKYAVARHTIGGRRGILITTRLSVATYDASIEGNKPPRDKRSGERITHQHTYLEN